MSELGDDFRNMRRARREYRQRNSHHCWKCQARVWNDEQECRKCGTQNERYLALQKTQR